MLNQELNQELHKAIDELSEIQKQRIIKYYFKNMKLEEIATEEKHPFKQWVKVSIMFYKNNYY